ncbi:Macrophage colony-stimulating factor 1 receptor [Paraconiothyrium brasiliense]|uniref:Macrophage colony-stimulating factor 1 receptor n=1 Tax=Paraconiothyrium brasiliense TaxID=300254 RepID=A0ABR3RW90_9PLEO
MAGSIVPEPLNPHRGFNWTIFFIFYFNRLFATLVSYAIRAYTWRAYRTYIDIQALQISLLGGRIFFKDVRYHGHNETILIHNGYITWNYWLRRVREAEVFSTDRPPPLDATTSDGASSSAPSGSRSRNVDKAEKGGKSTQKRLPCRVSVKISGVEAFLYNRTPAYDGIIDAIRNKAKGANTEDGTPLDQENTRTGNDVIFRTSTEVSEDQSQQTNKLRKAPAKEEGISRPGTDTTNDGKTDGLPAFLKILPVYVECNKGAIVIGNEHTVSVITAQFEKVTGDFDAAPSGPLDLYQQVFNFQVTHPVVHMKPNPDYKSPQLDAARRLKQEEQQGVLEREEMDEKRKHRGFRLPRIPKLFSKSSDSIHTHHGGTTGRRASIFAPQWYFPGQEKWKGLSRYMDDNQIDGHGEWDGVEYAKTSLIADCPCVNVSFYWDVAGRVPTLLDNSMYTEAAQDGDINGNPPPEYGVDIQVYGGVINYGPWTDRHRGIFQSFFFPGAHVDAEPASPLKPGDTRVLTVFKLYLSIEDETVLRIPVREPSKDWKWKGKAKTLGGQDKNASHKTKGRTRSRRKHGRTKQDTAASGQNMRPFGWIDIKVAGNSSVNYVMDMVASPQGFNNKLDVDIASTEISSSVNHGLLWRSGAIGLDCDLSNPISWNSLRKWMFNISCRDLELFLLRDHLFLLTDLVADWGSGPPANYFTFVPFQYLLNVDFTDFKLYLNTNDSNIINNPSELDENSFINLFGQRLHGDVTIPLDKFRPSQNEIHFDVKGEHLGLEVCMPPKNTLHTWVRSRNVAQLGGLTLRGSHTLMTETSTMNTDRLFMDIRGDRLHLELYGWLVHHFMKIKENYFGDDLHFRTLEEFQGLQSHSLAMDTTTPNGQPPKISNDLDVILSISVETASVLLPANLYAADAGLRADLPFAHCDLRFTNYYMDLLVDFSPISLSVGCDVSSPGLPHDIGGQTEVFIDSLTIAGHRLFGLPPSEPTYVCNWDFDVGTISGECTSNFLAKAATSIKCFAFSLDDDENTLPITDPLVIHDSTFLRLRTHDIHLWLHVDKQVVLIGTGPVKLDFNDLAGDTFSRRLNAWIPNVRLSAIDERAALRYGSRSRDTEHVKSQAFFETTVSFTMFNRKLNFTEERKKQHTHMLEHDQRTNRAQFMYMEHATNQLPANQEVRPPTMQFPEIPQPIFLNRPGVSASDASSGYSSGSAPSLGRTRSLASSSRGSFVNSIRSGRKYWERTVTQSSSRSRTLQGSPTRARSPNGHLPHHSEKARIPGALPSSVALSSPLAAPTSSLDLIDMDMSEVPSFPDLPPRPRVNRDDAVQFNDVSTKHFDESFEHTSLIIETEPGIRLYCTPDFVRCISGLISTLQPREPQDLLDEFQINAMTAILDRQKRREGKGKSIEFSVRVPWMHLRFQNVFGPHLGAQVGIDQYDVILNRLHVAVRDKKLVGARTGESSISAHTTLGSLGISVTERKLNGPNDDVAVQAEINNLLVWLLKNKETHVHVNSKAFEIATASRKIDYMASLIHRSTMLGDDLANRFVSIKDTQQNRLRYLALRLTTAQEQLQDPAFLTKATFALRAVRDHLRSHDSWKIISRFRYIWQTLSDHEKRRIRDHCTVNSVRCPEDAEERIVTMWDQWRAWDLAHVEKSLAMRMLFGIATMEQPEEVGPSPVYLDVRSAGIKVILDPGTTQSEVALRILAISVALIPPPEPAGLMLVGSEIQKRSTVVQINSGETAVRVHWEICELMDVLINLFEKENLRRSRSVKSQPPCSPDQKKRQIEDSLQFVYVTEKATIALDTINLRSLLIGRRFRLSVVNEDSRPSKQGITTTVIVHLEEAVMELLSRSRLLLRSQFDSPSVYFAHHQFTVDGSMPDEIKVAGASKKIEVRLEENVLGLLEVADSVLRDEVAYFHGQAMLVKRSLRSELEPTDRPKMTQLPNISLALLMDRYAIHLALLESLSWSITGNAGRVSVGPSMGENVTLRIYYDLAACRHRMFSTTVNASNLISSLEFPPVNGRIAVTNMETQTKIYAAGIIETVQLQAAEVQALVATINKPEISNVVRAVSDDINGLTTRFREIIPQTNHASVAKTPDSSREIVFGVQMTLSGINVRASAPGQYPDSPMANLAVRLSSIQLRATNIGRNSNILALPEAIVLLQEISVDLTLSDKKSIRRCGNITFAAVLQVTAEQKAEPPRRVYRLKSSGLAVNIFADTASAVVDVMNHLQDKIKDLDLSTEKKYLKKLRHTKSKHSHKGDTSTNEVAETDAHMVSSGALFTSTYSLELLDIYVSWIVGNSIEPYPKTESEDLVLSFRRIDLSTRKDDAARLTIEDMQLQMVPVSASKKDRSANSALLPEVVFNVAYSSTQDTRKVAFHAAGKALHLLLDSRFIRPANVIERSIALAGKKFRAASANWRMTPTTDGAQRKNPFGNKRLASLSVDASFAGAVVHINGSDSTHDTSSTGKESKSQQKGRYSQFVGDSSKSSLVLRAPGIALKVENEDDGQDPTLKAELRIDASSNTLFPTVVPVIIEMSESIKEVVREKDEDSPLSPAVSKPQNDSKDTKPAAKLLEEDNLITVDPSTILGRKRLNLGVRICKQEFSLSCQPIARVAAIAKLEDIYITVNSVKSQDHGHFFAASAAFEKLEATVQHVYSRESTFGFNVDSIVLSMMNSKHLSGTSGISAILKINPTALQINARQLQDFLLFREIWIPPEIRRSSSTAPTTTSQEPQEYLMQRYHQVTAATAFPWNANVAIADVSVDLDLGQTIGKSSLRIQNLWASSRKGIDWEQNLCVGIEKIGIESTGRTNGFVDLGGVKVRTSISWPSQDLGSRQTPLIQASVGFQQLRVKAAFDYQAFLIADIANFDFLMYNVREHHRGKRDRLVAILDGDHVHVLCTATSAAQGLALWQAIERLILENQQAYKQSLKDIEKFLRRKSSVAVPNTRSASQSMIAPKPDTDEAKTPISLHTDVVVTLRSISLGIFPSTFIDTQILHLEAADAQARFAVALEKGKIHSTLGMTLGQLSVALSSVQAPKKQKPVGELTVEDIVSSAKSAKGGTILRVPKVIATMHTWQAPTSNHIDYVFKSSLEGKVDVGWNYSRISYIRTMWGNHTRTLASRLGKPLPEPNIKITSSQAQPAPSSTTTTQPSSSAAAPPAPDSKEAQAQAQGQEKITAVVNVPQSKYEYTALEPPLIETPQLRDMGEATPPLEWIGLHRDRLPNVTHQIVIVTLLEVAREVEEAYERILGSS